MTAATAALVETLTAAGATDLTVRKLITSGREVIRFTLSLDGWLSNWSALEQAGCVVTDANADTERYAATAG